MKGLDIIEDRHQYHTWCSETENQVPIYYQGFWLDAVCSNYTWKAFIVRLHGKVIGIWPLYIRQSWFMKWVDHPLFTPHLGLFVRLEGFKEHKLHSLYRSIYSSFQRELSKYPIVRQQFHPNNPYALLIYYYGFKLIPRYKQLLTLNLKKEHNNEALNSNIQDFIQAQRRLFKQSGFPKNASNVFENLIANLQDHTQINVYHSRAAYLADVYYNNTCYSLGNNRGSDRKAVEELRLESMYRAAETNTYYDFRGSSMEGVYVFNAKFGANTTIFYRGIRTRNWLLRLFVS